MSTDLKPDPSPLAPLLNELRDPEQHRAKLRGDGFDAGYRDGLAAAAADHAAAVAGVTGRLAGERSRARQLLHDMAEAGVDWRAAAHRATAGASTEAVSAAVALAEAIVGFELRHSTAPVLDALARALAALPEGPAEVRANPADVELLDLQDCTSRPLRIVADPAVEPGGCIATTGAATVDAQVGAAIERVRLALGLTA